jgi:hypothetical protein
MKTRILRTADERWTVRASGQEWGLVDTYVQAEALACIVGRMSAIDASGSSTRTARAVERMLADQD